MVETSRTTKPASAPGVVAHVPSAPRRIPFDAPWAWLAAGWRDVWSAPHVSLTYGAVFAIIAAALGLGLWSLGAHSAFLALAGGFMLVGPFVGVGLYETSRRLQRGQPVSVGEALAAAFGARGQLAFLGAMLLFAFMLWLQIAFLLLMLFMGGTGLPPASEFVSTLLFTNRGLGLLIVGSIVGGLIATVVFAISVVAVPMLLVQPLDAVTAARASIAAVERNPRPMALWAGLIVVMIAAGFATLLLGLVIAFPLIGHATWHAYVDIYGDAKSS